MSQKIYNFCYFFADDDDEEDLPAPPPEIAKAKVEETLLDLKDAAQDHLS